MSPSKQIVVNIPIRERADFKSAMLLATDAFGKLLEKKV
jgi:hypothetical protein